MENFDFNSSEKINILNILFVKPRWFIFAMMTFNFINSIYNLLITSLINFDSFSMLQMNLLDSFNIIITLLVVYLFRKVKRLYKFERPKLINLYFYFTVLHIVFYLVHQIAFCYEAYNYYCNRFYNRKSVGVVLFSFVPSFMTISFKILCMKKLYYASKMIE